MTPPLVDLLDRLDALERKATPELKEIKGSMVRMYTAEVAAAQVRLASEVDAHWPSISKALRLAVEWLEAEDDSSPYRMDGAAMAREAFRKCLKGE